MSTENATIDESRRILHECGWYKECAECYAAAFIYCMENLTGDKITCREPSAEEVIKYLQGLSEYCNRYDDGLATAMQNATEEYIQGTPLTEHGDISIANTKRLMADMFRLGANWRKDKIIATLQNE